LFGYTEASGLWEMRLKENEIETYKNKLQELRGPVPDKEVIGSIRRRYFVYVREVQVQSGTCKYLLAHFFGQTLHCFLHLDGFLIMQL
jgi:hypothetical protein